MKSLTFSFAAGAAFLLLVQPVSALTLTGTVRDFVNPGVPGYAAHPDFEAPLGSFPVVTGAVVPTLVPGGKPVLNGSPYSFTSAAAFDQWYQDVPGVNQATTINLALAAVGGGIYEYVNSSFFPIDDQLLGNQGRSHNYHFTMEVHNTFTYQGGEMFSFTGDDDLWLFINNELVVDLGGVHPAATGSVNLDTLGLTVGNDYSFDLFFAERHTTESNFRMQTSIQLKPVPELSPTVFLLGLSCVGLGALRRK